MKQNLLIAIAFATVFLCLILFLLGKSILPAIIAGAIAEFLVYALWDAPKKDKEFSDSDRLQATGRALGGNGPPELPLPGGAVKQSKKKSIDIEDI